MRIGGKTAAIPELPRISDYVFHHAGRTPEKCALVWGRRRITYAGLAAEMTRTARALLAAGLEPGGRVAMLCTPQPEYFITFLATAAVGGIWLGLNPRYRLSELRHLVAETRPRILIGLAEADGRDYRPDYAALARDFDDLGSLVIIGGTMPGAVAFEAFLAGGEPVEGSRLDSARAAVGPDGTALIIFTSGSTGAPKGAMLRHFGLVHGALTEHRHWPSASPVVLSNLPANHIAGLGMTTAYGLVTGGTIVFQDRFDAGGCLELIERERVTFWLQAPAMLHFAATHPGFGKFDLSSLDYVIWGGAPMAHDLVVRLGQLDARLATAFGMTELSTYALYSDPDASPEVLAATIGRPEPSYDLRLADAEGRSVPPGAEGEIQARGRWLMGGYFNRPQETAAAYTADGWFRTGDVAVARPDGNWTLVGRLKEMYKSGGYNIYPREIEIALEKHPAVAMAAVIGVPDPVFNEVGHAFVQPPPGKAVSDGRLQEWCREHLANYKVPKRFTILAELPRLASGKIDKQSLKRSVLP